MVIFKFEKWITDRDFNEFSLNLIEVVGDAPILKMPMFYVGDVFYSDVINPCGLTLEEIDEDHLLGAYLSEFHSDPVEWEDWNDEYCKYYPILKCPISGKKLKVEIVKTIDRTDEYNALKDNVDALTEKWRNEDSISKKNELDKERRKLWDKMNEMLEGKYYGWEN